MRILFLEVIASLWVVVRRLRLGSRARDLKRELRQQATEDYWILRKRSRSRRFWLVKNWYGLRAFADGARDRLWLVRSAIPQLLRAFLLGGVVLATVILAEMWLAHRFVPKLVPIGDPKPVLSAFPTLAVQVSASLLGFYLASVGIVLGTSYQRVSADVRALVIESVWTGFSLKLVGMTIGAGLALVLMENFGASYGYLAISAYALLVAISGWGFFNLALGAFNLFNPMVLGNEPLRVLFKAISRLDSRGLTRDEAALQATSQEADRALRIMAELISLTSKRAEVDRNSLAKMVIGLLIQIRIYAQRKHLLEPTSAWFIREQAYPRWVEADQSSVSIALQTSTPLPSRQEPMTDWLEKRSAELVSAAIEACVLANDRDTALWITRAAALTAEALAEVYRIDDSIAFSAIIRDRCWAIESNNDAAVAVVAEPPMLLSGLLLGWNRAIESWAEEVRKAVSETNWDSAKTTVVHMPGPRDVWTAAQRRLAEVHAEHAIEGRRVTPDWYLQLALADACILSLSEFATQFPELMDDFAYPQLERFSPAAKALTAGQALQALAKAQLLAETIPEVANNLESLRLGNEPKSAEELEGLIDSVQVCQSSVLKKIADVIVELKPEQSESFPDLFGGSLFTLIHHTEQAIARGDVALVKNLFPSIIQASQVLQQHVVSTYQPPRYQYSSLMLDPTVDLLEISGLAIIYEALRGDSSADPVREAWKTHIGNCQQPERVAKGFLDFLDSADGGLGLAISPRDIARTEWHQRVTSRIVDAGYAVPTYAPFGKQPKWTGPPLIRMLAVSQSLLSLSIRPRAIFAAQVVGPMSGETEETLRGRAGLHRYYVQRDFHGAHQTSEEGVEETDNHESENDGDGFQ